MPSLISADAWPVFDCYALTRYHGGGVCIGPAKGATIRGPINLMEPSLRHSALLEALGLTKKAGRPRKDEETRVAMGLGAINEDALLEYASRYGLFGLGPSRILRITQQTEELPGWTLFAHRVAGRLDSWQEKRCADPLVVLDSRPYETDPTWEQYLPVGIEEAEVFRHVVGSDAWWELYVEPLGEIATALYELHTPAGVERLLADTFVDLAGAFGPKTVERARVGWRSVSAMGALAIDVVQGGLQGWGICDYELCRLPFQGRKRQRFCSTACRTSKHDRDVRAEATNGGGRT